MANRNGQTHSKNSKKQPIYADDLKICRILNHIIAEFQSLPEALNRIVRLFFFDGRSYFVSLLYNCIANGLHKRVVAFFKKFTHCFQFRIKCLFSDSLRSANTASHPIAIGYSVSTVASRDLMHSLLVTACRRYVDLHHFACPPVDSHICGTERIHITELLLDDVLQKRPRQPQSTQRILASRRQF